MIENVVRYLREQGVAFKLECHPAPERLPPVAHAIPPGGRLVAVHVVRVGDRPAIACVPDGERVNLERLTAELRVPVTVGRPTDLPGAWARAGEPVPPLGGLMGVPLFVDERVARAAVLAFRAYSDSDYFEVPYDEYARVERPRVSALGIIGELPEAHAPM